jgi:hypothetical protein
LKKIYRCPHCHQTSTRRWNLERHIERKHKAGQPTLTYVSGQSSFSLPPSANNSSSNLGLAQNDSRENFWRDYTKPVYSNRSYIPDSTDKSLDRLAQIIELSIKTEQLPKTNPIPFFPQRGTPQYFNPFSGKPDYITIIETEQKPIAVSDGVIGFKA